MRTIDLYVGNSSSGNMVYENLPVDPLGEGRYRLLASPGLVLGVAKGDEIKLLPENGRFELLARGNNLCIQIYISPNLGKEIGLLETQIAEGLKGSLDGKNEDQLVFSIPVSSGFAEVEQVLNAFVDRNPDCEWYYGNVYDAEDGVTPLNWWLGD